MGDLQLASQVALLAKYLIELGLRPGDRLVLSFPPGLEFFVAFLACITQGYSRYKMCNCFIKLTYIILNQKCMLAPASPVCFQ